MSSRGPMRITDKIEEILTNKLPYWWRNLTPRYQENWADLDYDGDDDKSPDELLEWIAENPPETVDHLSVMEANIIGSMTANSTYWLSDEGKEKFAEFKPTWPGQQPYSTYGHRPTDLPEGGLHMPVIDLDLNAKLVKSSSGNNHLFINKEMTWEKYKALLQALADAGLVQQGYVDTSIARGQSDARMPWIEKSEELEGYPLPEEIETDPIRPLTFVAPGGASSGEDTPPEVR